MSKMQDFKLDSLVKDKNDVPFSGGGFESGFEKVFNNSSIQNSTAAFEIKSDNSFFQQQAVKRNEVKADAAAPSVSEKNVQEARSKGYEDGYAKGYSDAKSASEQIDKQTAETVKLIDAKLAQILQDRKFDDLKKSEDVIDLALRIARKVADDALSNNACQQVEKVVLKSFELMFDEPKIVINVHPSIEVEIRKRVENLVKKEGFSGQADVVANEKVVIGDCEIQWQGGGMKNDKDAIWNEITRIIE